jgi:hypothetical protein
MCLINSALVGKRTLTFLKVVVVNLFHCLVISSVVSPSSVLWSLFWNYDSKILGLHTDTKQRVKS